MRVGGSRISSGKPDLDLVLAVTLCAHHRYAWTAVLGCLGDILCEPSSSLEYGDDCKSNSAPDEIGAEVSEWQIPLSVI